MIRKAVLLLAAGLLAACSAPVDLEAPAVPLGDFSLGHNVVVAPRVQTTSTVSREVAREELTESLKLAIAERFDGYTGPREYHFGVSIEGYVLARAGIPVLAAPKSAMIIRVTVWDDAAGKKLNDTPEQLTILEQASGASVIGTGWSRDAQEQLRDLSVAAAKAIEDYLLGQVEAEGWFYAQEAGVDASDGTSTSTVTELLSSSAPLDDD
ncbi:MAG: hypothetical protein AB8B58_10865 [Roseobacter sp.]